MVELSVDTIHVETAFDDGIAIVTSSDYEINSAIESIIVAAERISDEYFGIFESLSGKNGNKIGSRLPSVRAKEGTNGRNLEIRWMRSVQGPEGRIRSAYLKGKSHQYNLAKITRGAPEWEQELVKNTELQFAKLRVAYSALQKVKYYLKTAHNNLNKELADLGDDYDD